MESYEISEDRYVSNDMRRYKQAMNDGKEVEAFLGNDLRYRIIHRDSMIQDYTDINVLIECCLFPLYAEGDTSIVERTERILRDFSRSDNIVKLYQVACFIRKQGNLLKRYDKLPFEIKTKPLILNIKQSLTDLTKEEQVYRPVFFTTSLYQVIYDMLEKNPIFDV